MERGMVIFLSAYRLAGHMTRDLELAAELVDDLISLGMLPDDVAARLSSFRDDVAVALEPEFRVIRCG
jgi:hypothetical protein